MKRLLSSVTLFAAMSVTLTATGVEAPERDAESLRFYYNGTWHASPTLDEEKDFFWDKGRKEKLPEGHIHRPKNGYIFKDGKWEVDRNTRVGKHQTGEHFYDGKWHNKPKPDIYNYNTYWLIKDFDDYIARKDFVSDTVEREYELIEEESARLVKLINNGDIEKILGIRREKEGRPQFIYDREELLMYAKARADLTAILITLVKIERIFEACAKPREDNMKCEVFSLIDPLFYENDPGRSEIVMAMNVSGILRLLDPDSHEYRRSGAAFFICSNFCTMAVLDTEEKLDEIRKYLDSMPYAPIRSRKKLSK